MNEWYASRDRGERRRYPVDEALALIMAAEAQGYRPEEIRAAAKLSSETFYAIKSRKYATVFRKTYLKLEQMKLTTMWVPSEKILVLEHALARMGWSQRDLARELGYKNVKQQGTWHQAKAVRPETAYRFLQVYLRLCYLDGPSEWTRAWARNQGWKTPHELEEAGTING